MKKLWISIGMVLGLFAAPAIAKAQETLPVIQNNTAFETLPIEWNLAYKEKPETSLPLGWSCTDLSDAETDYQKAAFAFQSIYNHPSYDFMYYLVSKNENLVNGKMSADVITPVFISPINKVTATFNIRFYDFVDGWDHEPTTPQDGDSVRIEYRLDGGEWQEASLFKEFPAADETGNIAITAMISDVKDRRIELRYTRYTARENSINMISSVLVTEEITCFPPTDLTIDTANVTDRQLALQWNDETNTTASYVVFYQEVGSTEAENWILKAATEKTAKLTELKPNTAYRMQVQAVCAADDTSAFNATPILFATYTNIPYTESLGDVYSDLSNPSDYTSPTERGVKTYTGKIGGNLTEANNYETWRTIYSLSGRTSERAKAMGTYEEATSAVFVSPRIYTAEPTVMNFTLNSFSLTKDEEFNFELKEKGVAPTEDSCRLYVAVSNEGEFTMEDVVLTLKGAELKLIDSTFELNVDKTGAVQIAFFFENPVEHWDDAFYLEAYDLSLTSVPQEYTLSLTATPAEGGTVTGAGRHKEGATVTVTATANEGYDFVAWMNGSAELAKTASYTFTMPAGDVSYTAVFRSNTPVVEPEEYELTLTASPANAGRVSGDGPYLAGEDVTISAEANQGYKFVAWVNGTDTLSKEATYTFQMPAKDTAFTARFVPEAANEEALRAGFSLGAKNGHLYIRNINGLTVKSVEVYSLTGHRINRFATESREDLILPVDAERALLFVRLDTEKGAAVYKVYLH